jgi:hypothetical protein
MTRQPKTSKTQKTQKKPHVSQYGKKLDKLLKAAWDEKGGAGVVEFISSLQYIYENLWAEIRGALCRKVPAVVVRVARDGGHAYLDHEAPHTFLPNDHPAIVLDVNEGWPSRASPSHERWGSWALCSGCGRPFQYQHAGNTALVLTSCPNLLHGTGVRLITRALPLVRP